MHHHRYACALPAGLALAALAVPAPADAAIDRSAGWHGREIRAPYARFADQPTPRFPRGWSAGAVERGSGYERRRGSQRVRELQTRLRRRGYRPGRVDGRFGARTRAAVLWFQVKHGLPRSGRGDALTIARLRDPSRPSRPVTAPLPTVAAATPAPLAAAAGTDWLALLLLALVILAGLAVIAAWLWHALHTPDAPTAPPVPSTPDTVEAPPASTIPGPPAPKSPRLALVPRPQQQAPVLGYVVVTRDGDLEISARAIGAWCEAHGWPLATVIHDGLPGRGRPGLDHALQEVRMGRAAGLVVNRLRDLTDSVSELGPLLQWFATANAFVIALDYEIDTSNHPGEIAARALAEASDWTQPGPPRRGAARGAAVADDPELATRITAMRNGGMSLQAIADALNDAGVPTLRGGARWRPSSVQAATGYKRPPAKARGVEIPQLRKGD